MMPHSPLVVYGAAAGISCKQSGNVWWGGEQDGGAAALAAAAAATAAVSWFPCIPQHNKMSKEHISGKKKLDKRYLVVGHVGDGFLVLFTAFFQKLF